MQLVCIHVYCVHRYTHCWLQFVAIKLHSRLVHGIIHVYVFDLFFNYRFLIFFCRIKDQKGIVALVLSLLQVQVGPSIFALPVYYNFLHI